MKIKLDKQLILESFNNIIQPYYIYHIGAKGYKDIRPLKFQKDNIKMKEIKAKSSPEYFESYISQVNAFLGNVTRDELSLLKKAEFKLYQDIDNLYIYKINLNDPVNRSKIKNINITSTSQQREYDNKHWKKFYKETKLLADKEYFKAKGQYIKKREDYLKSKGIISTTDVDRFFNLPYIEDWSNVKKHFKKNIMCGNKNQYASCIPHIQVQVNGPLKFESVSKI